MIYIKSKYLLPSLALEEEEGIDLEQQLKIYREYYEASKRILKMIGKKRFAYVRTHPLKLPRERMFSPPVGLSMADMVGVFSAVLGRLERIIQLPKIILKRTMSIKDKISAMREAILSGIVKFHDMYDKTNKLDVIVSFLALLELMKARVVTAQQDRIFSDIHIIKQG